MGEAGVDPPDHMVRKGWRSTVVGRAKCRPDLLPHVTAPLPPLCVLPAVVGEAAVEGVRMGLKSKRRHSVDILEGTRSLGEPEAGGAALIIDRVAAQENVHRQPVGRA